MELKEPELFDYLKEFYYSDLEKSEEFDNQLLRNKLAEVL